MSFEKFKSTVKEFLELDILSKDKILYILSASPNSICNKEKIEWLKKYMPFIKEENIYFVGNKEYKIVMLRHLIKKLNLENKDCTLIDDEHAIINDAIKLNINSIHPSKFLTNF